MYITSSGRIATNAEMMRESWYSTGTRISRTTSVQLIKGARNRIALTAKGGAAELSSSTIFSNFSFSCCRTVELSTSDLAFSSCSSAFCASAILPAAVRWSCDMMGSAQNRIDSKIQISKKDRERSTGRGSKSRKVTPPF